MYRPLTSSIPTKLRHVYVPPSRRRGGCRSAVVTLWCIEGRLIPPLGLPCRGLLDDSGRDQRAILVSFYYQFSHENANCELRYNLPSINSC